MTGLRRFLGELRRRRVIRVAAVYVVAAWVTIEVASVVLPELLLPDWSLRLLIVLAACGFPFAMVLAWVFDITPEGVQRTSPDADTATAAPAPATLAKRPPPPERSLAVLPFRNIGGDRDNEYFCEGLAEDLLIVLSRVKGLRVAARSSSFAFRDGVIDVRGIGEQLNVATVLEGSVRKSGRLLRVAVRLVDTADGYQRWSRAFDRELGDIFDIQDEISRAVFDALEVEVYGGGRPRITPGTRDVEAYNLYLMGRHQFHRRSEASLESAVRFFEQSIARDPGFALPYSGLADAWLLLSHSGEGYGRLAIPEAIARAEPLVRRALELAPDSAEAHASKGFLARLRGDNPGAEAALRRAMELDPSYPMAQVWLGLTLVEVGRMTEALHAFERAHQTDPLSPIIGTNLAFANLAIGRFDAAREQFGRVIEIAPEFPVPYSGMAFLARRLGRPAEARAWWERAHQAGPTRANYPVNLALLALESGDAPAAARWLETAEALSPLDPTVLRCEMAVRIAADRFEELLSITDAQLARQPGDAHAQANAALARLLAGDAPEARRRYGEIGEDLLHWTSEAVIWSWRFAHSLHFADALLRTGERERGMAELERAATVFTRLEAEHLHHPDLPYQQAAMLSLRGDLAAAEAALGRALDRGWPVQWWARRDPSLAALRSAGAAVLDRLRP